jgi:pimeloyl-ACP methyl ester carboxylesterase
VLTEYYGPNWQSDTSAKVIIVAHSMGCATSREVIREEPRLAAHIKKFVLLDGANNGSYLADFGWVVAGAMAVCAIKIPPLWAKLTIAGGDLLVMFVGYKLMNSYTDAVWDLRSFITLGFIPQLNQATQTPPPGVEWACLVGRDPLPAGEALAISSAVAAGLVWAGLLWEAAVVEGAGITIEWWNHNSDLIIQTSSQDIVRQACPNYQRELIEDDCLAHADALKKWEYIRDFLEPPVFVSIDSAIVFKDGERRAYALPNENNVIESPVDSIFLKGRTNCYFLANADFSFSGEIEKVVFVGISNIDLFNLENIIN